MTDAEVRAIALFFFFALLDEKKAIEAASIASDHCAKLMRNKKSASASQAIVISCFHTWKKLRRHLHRGRPTLAHELGWLTFQEANLGPWKEFQKTSPEDELITMIWSRVLKIPDRDIASALDLPEGTIRYRVGKALKRIGKSVQPYTVKGLQ
jgi:hypothetical protein